MLSKAVVIVSYEVSESILNYYNSLTALKEFYLVTPVVDKNLESQFDKLTILADSDILKRTEYEMIESTPRPNWYYQQILKYKIVLDFDYDIVHIIDGDTLIRENLLFNDGFSYYTSKSIEKEYQDFIFKVAPKSKLLTHNFITNQLVFRKDILKECIGVFNKNHADWIHGLCSVLIENPTVMFSEYQFYLNYRFNNEREFTTKRIKVFRRIDLLKMVDIKVALDKYEVIAYENMHRKGLIRRLRSELLYLLKMNHG